jgi:hypothetical protein
MNKATLSINLLFITSAQKKSIITVEKVHAAARNCDTRKLSMRSSPIRLACKDFVGRFGYGHFVPFTAW